VRQPLLLLVALLLGPAGCGTGPGGGGGLPAGRAFAATGATEHGRERPLVARAGIEFLAGGRTSVATGCNSAGGTAELHDGRLVTDGFAITEMACLDAGVMEQETFVMSVIEGRPEVLLEGDVLLLSTATAELRFLDRRVADPDRPLEATRWRVTGQFDPQVASSSVALTGDLVLLDGRARFTGPCHDAEGPAAVKGAEVTFGPLGTSPLRPCSQDQQQAQAASLRLLSGTLHATVRSATLTLTRPDGTGLTFSAAG
jgi:heat shock protein HslJ